jgi:hypothetical protein
LTHQNLVDLVNGRGSILSHFLRFSFSLGGIYTGLYNKWQSILKHFGINKASQVRGLGFDSHPNQNPCCSGWVSYMLDLLPLWWRRDYFDIKIPRFCNIFFPQTWRCFFWMQICYKKSKGQWRTCLKWLSEFIISTIKFRNIVSYHYYNWISTFFLPCLNAYMYRLSSSFSITLFAAAVPLSYQMNSFSTTFFVIFLLRTLLSCLRMKSLLLYLLHLITILVFFAKDSANVT